MKKTVFVLLMISLSNTVFAQLSASDYLLKTPSIPEMPCSFTDAQQIDFLKKVNMLDSMIRKDIEVRNKSANQFTKSQKDSILQQTLQQSGLSADDIQKATSGKKLSKADANEMANHITMQKANISIDEAKNLKNMSKEGREAWAKAYAAEQMAMAQSGQSQQNSANNNSMAQYNALQEQSILIQKLTSLQQQYQQICAEGDTESAQFEQQLEPLKNELLHINYGEGATRTDMDHAKKINNEIRVLQEAFCEKMSLKMIDFLKNAKANTTAWLPDYDKIEILQNKNIGLSFDSKHKGLAALQGVMAYIGYLKDVFRYKIHTDLK